MCQTCCLGFSQHRQEGGMSSSYPGKEALVIFTNLRSEQQELPNCRQLKAGGPQFPFFGHSMPPQHPWHGRIPSQGSWRKQTSSDHQASLLCCQQNPQYRHTQWTALLSPGISPKSQIQGFPKLGTVAVCLQPECALWGRMAGAVQCKCYKDVIYKRSDLFTCHPTAVNSD